MAERIAAIKPSPTLALNSAAKDLARDGAEILNFAVGELDFQTPAKVREAAKTALDQGRTKYGVAGGGLPIRTAIVDKLARENGLTYKPEEIATGIGAKEILFHLNLGLFAGGDQVLGSRSLLGELSRTNRS